MNVNARIKKQYLDMILRGAKKTEYRDMSEYWTRKLVDTESYKGKDVNDIIQELQSGELKLNKRPITQITFWCNEQNVIYKVLDIIVYKGHKIYAIKLGDKIS